MIHACIVAALPDGFALLHADSLFTLQKKPPLLSTAAGIITAVVESPSTDRAVSSTDEKQHQGGKNEEDAVTKRMPRGPKKGMNKKRMNKEDTGDPSSSNSRVRVGAAKKIRQKDGKKSGKKEKNKKGKKAKTQESLSD